MIETLDYSGPATVRAQAAAPPQPGWASAIALTAAAVCVGYAIHVRDGEYWPTAIHKVGLAILLCAAGVAFPRVRQFRWSGGAVLVVLWAAVLLQFGLLLSDSPGGSNWWSNDIQNTSAGNFLFYNVAVRAACLLVLLSLWPDGPRARWGRRLFALVLLAHFALGAWMIRSSPGPHVDVFVFQQSGAEALLRGDNPYNITFPDIYRETAQGDRPVYGKGLYKDGRLGFGFPYTPLSLLLSTAGYAVAGDHRYAQVLAMTLAGALVAYTRPGRIPLLAAAGLLFTPRAFFILGRGWTEPFVVLGLAAVVFVAYRRAGATPASAGAGAKRRLGGTDALSLAAALGLFLVTKQYLIFAIPAAFLLLPRPVRWKPTLLLLGVAAIVALAVTLPLALWDVRSFIHSTWTVQKVAPFRDDALSYLVWYAQKTGVRPGVGVAFAALLAATALALWRAPRTAAGFAAALALIYLPFIALNKQAFANYYYFTLGALWCAVAAMPVDSGQELRTGGQC